MSSTANWYPNSSKAMFEGAIQSTNTFNIMLLNSSGTFNAAHTLIANVSTHQISGTGYTAGGALTSVTASLVGGEVRFNVSAVDWPSATFTARNAVLYSATTGALLIHIAFAGDVAVAGQRFTLLVPDPLPAHVPVTP